MAVKIVSIRTRAGDDLTPTTTSQPAQPISQRQAIQQICRRADPPIWPVVEKRLMDAAEESDRGIITWPWRLLSLSIFAGSAAAVIYLVMWIAAKVFR